MRECRFYIGGKKSRRIEYRQGERSVSRRKESGIDERDRVQERNVGEPYRSGSGAEVERLLLKARNVSKKMTFPTGLDFRKYSDEELTAMLVEAGEASKHARKRGRATGIEPMTYYFCFFSMIYSTYVSHLNLVQMFHV